jgi:hypothetical protein
MEAEGKDPAEAGGELGIDFEMRGRVALRAAGQDSFPGQGTPTRRTTNRILIGFRGFPERCRRPQG